MEFLYAKDHIVAIARFWEEEVNVGIISTNSEDVTIRLPVGAVGAVSPIGETDAFGKALEYTLEDRNSISMKVRAHSSYFMECRVK